MFTDKILDAADRAIAAAVEAGDVSMNGIIWRTTDDARKGFARTEVATALLFLAGGPVTTLKRIPSRGAGTSYGWKHTAEKWGRLMGLEPYITNGEFIVAADWLGIPSRREIFSLNVVYALKSTRNYNADLLREYRWGDASWERTREGRQLYAFYERKGGAKGSPPRIIHTIDFTARALEGITLPPPPRMTPKAGTHAYEHFIAAGWTPEQLRAEGYML